MARPRKSIVPAPLEEQHMPEQRGNGSTEALVAAAETEVQASVMMAIRYPRNEDRAMLRIEKSARRDSFAKTAIYRYPRGEMMVEGPSVALARELARSWGNVKFGLRVLAMDDDTVHIQGYCKDLEANNEVTMEDKFRKLVLRKGVGWITPDERDLRELINRRGAILVRNSILQVIPQDVQDFAMDTCRATLLGAAPRGVQSQQHYKASPATVVPEVKATSKTVDQIVTAFAQFGITRLQIEGYLKRKLDDISQQDVSDLRAVYTSIADGQSKAEEYFGPQAHDESEDVVPETGDIDFTAATGHSTEHVHAERKEAPKP